MDVMTSSFVNSDKVAKEERLITVRILCEHYIF